MGDPPGWGLGKVLTTPHLKKPASYKILHRKNSLKQPGKCKMDMRFEIWNVRSLYRAVH
jgi:hypothetical protein